MSTLEGLERIKVPEITPDQWAAIRRRLKHDAPDLVDMLCGEEL